MKREATVLYLQNIRDLEYAKLRIKEIANEDSKLTNRKINELTRSNLIPYPEQQKKETEDSLTLTTPSVIGLIVIGSYMAYASIKFDNSSYIVTSIFAFVVAILLSFSAARNRKKYNTRVDTIRQHNEQENKRLAIARNEAEKLKAGWEKRAQQYNADYRKVDEILNDFYSQNIIPMQYRNSFSAIEYIYEYMSTSQSDLRDALFSRQIEAGIQRLESKLDMVMSQLNDVIYETRCIRENSERTIVQNLSMLNSLRRVEANTLEAAQYEKLSMDYNRANAFFSEATYFQISDKLK